MPLPIRKGFIFFLSYVASIAYTKYLEREVFKSCMCRKSPISVAADAIYMISQLNEKEKKALKGVHLLILHQFYSACIVFYVDWLLWVMRIFYSTGNRIYRHVLLSVVTP